MGLLLVDKLTNFIVENKISVDKDESLSQQVQVNEIIEKLLSDKYSQTVEACEKENKKL